ncbi:MAG: hypothetical protein PHX30_06390, partial [Candidatus Pacebacteria bacterium]|nr:hypothetical protein [Candidatus Paceibacterota bacterium]
MNKVAIKQSIFSKLKNRIDRVRDHAPAELSLRGARRHGNLVTIFLQAISNRIIRIVSGFFAKLRMTDGCHPEDASEGSRYSVPRAFSQDSSFSFRMTLKKIPLLRGGRGCVVFWVNKTKRQKLTASILTFILIFQTIAGVFIPYNIFNTNPEVQVLNAAWFNEGGTWQ